MNSKCFHAPWGTTLRWVSVLSCAVLLGVLLTLTHLTGPDDLSRLAVLPVLILAISALFAIRGYTLEPDALAVQRLLWATRLPLSGLQSATVQPDAMRGSLRLWGNGGLFSITGWYRNRALGNYRAFVTDLKRTVVLRFSTRTIIISPENPERFVSEIEPFASRR